MFPLPESSDEDEYQQGYIAKDAGLPHYQGQFSDFLQYALAFNDPVDMYIYDNRLNHHNHFLLVVNNGMAPGAFVDWDAHQN